MCIQSLYQHPCANISRGSLATCVTPSTRGNHTSRIVTPNGAAYSTYAGRFVAAPGPTLVPLAIPSYPVPLTVIPVPVSLTRSFITYPSLAPPSYTTSLRPPYSERLQAGNVPARVPRQVRYEMIGGFLTPVEHFNAADIGMDGRRGWNTIHGFDDGPQQYFGSTIGWNPVHGYDNGPLSPGLGSSGGWNPVHGFDNGPSPPGFASSGAIAAQLFRNQTSATQASPLAPPAAPTGSTGKTEPSKENIFGDGGQNSPGENEKGGNASAKPRSSELGQDGTASDTASSTTTTGATAGSETPPETSIEAEGSRQSSQRNSEAPKNTKRVRIADEMEIFGE